MSTDNTGTGGITKAFAELGFAIAALFVLQFILTSTCRSEAALSAAPFTFSNMAGGVVTLIITGVIFQFGRSIETRGSRTIGGSRTVVDEIATLAKYFVFLLGIVIAYEGLADLVLPLLIPEPGMWVYDVTFLVLAMIPTGLIIRGMFNNVEEFTQFIATTVDQASGPRIECLECESFVRSSDSYCAHCGTDVQVRALED